MEIFSRHTHEKDPACRRRHILHCILHATLQVATLAATIITLNEVDKLRKDVKTIRRK